MIIIGLGNPGPEYVGTRHNLGFVVLDALATALSLDWSADREVLVARTDDHWLIKPQAYMNRSGQAVKDFVDYKNIPATPADLLSSWIVVHDELDFDPGTVKAQRSRSSAGHNGVQSIIDAFGTKDFSRIRIGIGKNEVIPNEDYVLQIPPAAEREMLDRAVANVVTFLHDLLIKPIG